MQDLARYRAMESLCRQSAVFNPLESWRLLAEAEMWYHKAMEELSCGAGEANAAAAVVGAALRSPGAKRMQ